jgi:hypothetical protein
MRETITSFEEDPMPPRGRVTPDRSPTKDVEANGVDPDTAVKRKAQPRVNAPDGELRFPLPLPGMPRVDVKRMLWLGGLGALATVGLLEWPVAITIGAASVVAERFARGPE